MQNNILPHPSNANNSFGNVPAKIFKDITIPGGEIFLKHGRHKGPNRGFGAEHIWAEHENEMKDAGFLTLQDVPAYVATIVSQGATLYCEFGGFRGFQKLSVVRTNAGTAILEFKGEINSGHYSVVTAYSKKYANGTRVGNVR